MSPWIIICPYEGYYEKYSNDVMKFDDGSINGFTALASNRVDSGDIPRHTHASQAWKHEVGGQLRKMVQSIAKSDYARNIVGYFFFPLAHESCYFYDYDRDKKVDGYSEAMKLAFRNFLIEKYAGNEDDLKKSWKDIDVSFETAAVPDRKSLEVPDYGLFWSLENNMKVYDYFECRSKTWAETLEYYSRICKEESGGRAIIGAFWGYLQNNDLLWGGQTYFKKMMESPFLDFWSTPYTYENRNLGGFASMRYAVKSLHKHNKLFFAEADSSISTSNSVTVMKQGYHIGKTKKDDENLLKRDFIYPLCEGTNGWWIDWPSGTSQYEEDKLLPLMRKMNEIGEETLNLPMGPITEIAVIIDQESLHTTPNTLDLPEHKEKEKRDSQLMQIAIDRMRVNELPFIESPIVFYETDDVIYEKDNRYKMYIFLNNYLMDDNERKAVSENLKKDGNVLVFMYGCGLINPNANEKTSAKNMTELIEIDMKAEMVTQRARMKITDTAEKLFDNLNQGSEIEDMDKKIIGGLGFSKNEHIPYNADPSIISPLFEINDDKSDIIGEYIYGQKAGFAIKEFEDWTSVYIGSPYIQADIIRAIAKKCNVHLFSQNKQAIIYANESFLGIHASSDGAIDIDLKRKCEVHELFNENEKKSNLQQFTVELKKGQSRLFATKKMEN